MVVTGPLSRFEDTAETERVEHAKIRLRPDPRISNLPPPWLPDRPDWRDLVDGLTDGDLEWIHQQWEQAKR